MMLDQEMFAGLAIFAIFRQVLVFILRFLFVTTLTVRSALKAAGVGDQVPEAEGYGEEFAKVPATAGDEERKVDRRTSLRLIK